MTTSNPELAKLFLDGSRKELLEKYWPQLRECVGSLTEEQVWWRPNDASNSIGNLLLHLNGNLDQWLVTSFTKDEVNRNRPKEFSTRDGLTAQELLARLDVTLLKVDAVLAALTPEELAATYTIQGQGITATGMEAIYHSISHFILHYGQIVYAIKSMQGRDLGFYRGQNKTAR